MHIWLILISLLGNALLPFLQPIQQEGAIFKNFSADIEFGVKITFHVEISSSVPVDQAFLILDLKSSDTVSLPVVINKNGEIWYEYDASQESIQPFSRLGYHYRLVLKDGHIIESEHQILEYRDNRFNWQEVQNPHFMIYWYAGDIQFGQELLNVAEQSLESLRRYTATQPSFPVRIYVYQSSSDLQGALQLSRHTWIAGHASPETGIVLVSINPILDQRLEMERQLPHELMHIVQYQMAGQNFSRLPIWLVEGMASMAELYPNPDYQRVLTNAAKSRSLLPLAGLCNSFPREAAPAFLAYAESASFMLFIYQNFGQEGIQQLVEQYRKGLGCEEGVEAAFGESLSKLELRWHQEALGINAGALALERLLPYLFLLAIITLSPIAMIFSLRRR